ncbi:AAA family ATPase [Piscinibacter sp.]|uniref:AAA family ATPase n=1 Tax=Piscinibacter sp. TaxID=1903157 RepID=UPI002C2351B4|nr:AAA family ATPase [Albitalea sp.]HUG22185.1 AAA family ATPase [Albitalea sp.]
MAAGPRSGRCVCRGRALLAPASRSAQRSTRHASAALVDCTSCARPRRVGCTWGGHLQARMGGISVEPGTLLSAILSQFACDSFRSSSTTSMTSSDDSRTDLRALIGKLGPGCRATVARAADLAYQRQHAALEIEHLALALVLEPGEDGSWLQVIGLDLALARNQLEQSLDRRERCPGLPPAIAGHVVELLRQAWLDATLAGEAVRLDTRSVFMTLAGSAQAMQRLCKAAPCWAVLAQSQARLNGPDAIDADVPGPQTGDALRRFTVDLTAQARAGKLDPVIGRDAEIEQVVEIMLRRRQNNPILTGEAGVGKTAIVEGLAQRIVAGLVPDALKSTQLRVLDTGLLKAGAAMQGELESRLRALISEVATSQQRIVLFIDEAHLLVGTNATGGENNVIASLIKPELARGTLTTIAATTWSEYKRFFEKDAALTRRFQVVRVPEPTIEQAEEILQALVGALQKHHGVRVLQSAIDAAVQLSSRYLHQRQLPDKAISLLDTACAKAQASMSAPLLADLATEQRRSYLASRIGALERDAADGHESEVDISALREELAKIDACPRAAEDAVHDAVPCVSGEQVGAVVTAWTGIPAHKIRRSQHHVAVGLEGLLRERVMGQDTAVRRICDRVRAYVAKLEDPGRPIGVFMLVGPSGVGKTETAHALAEAFFGESAITVINMSEYQEAHTVSKLKGAPAGYVGYGQGGVLTEAIRKRPYGLLLLDEVEKAHPDVVDLFLQVFDKGYMEDSEGVPVDFRNTMVLLTSNVGADVLQGELLDAHPVDLESRLEERLLKRFKPEFLGRLQIVPYLRLSQDTLQRIAHSKLAAISNRFRSSYGQELHFSPTLVDHLLERAQRQVTGARWIDQYISTHVLSLLATVVLDHMGRGEVVPPLHADFRDDCVRLDPFVHPTTAESTHAVAA